MSSKLLKRTKKRATPQVAHNIAKWKNVLLILDQQGFISNQMIINGDEKYVGYCEKLGWLK